MAVATSILLPSHRSPLNPVECMLTNIAPVSPLKATLTNSVLYKSFVFHSYAKHPGGVPPWGDAATSYTAAQAISLNEITSDELQSIPPLLAPFNSGTAIMDQYAGAERKSRHRRRKGTGNS